MNRICTVDIESNSLLNDTLDYSSFPYKLKEGSRLWCIVVTDISTMQPIVIQGNSLNKGYVSSVLENFDTFVLHNGHKFDLVVLKLFGLIDYKIGYIGEKDILNGREVRFIDTLVMSRLLNPDRLGGHSLNAWGKRVGDNKMDYREKLIRLGALQKNSPKGTEFSFFHEEMIPYCIQDTFVTAKVYVELIKEMDGYKGWTMALQQEHKLADLAVKRELFGFWFDKELAVKNIEELTGIMDEIQVRVNPILPKKPLTQAELNNITPPTSQLKKDGTWSSHMKRFVERLELEHNEEHNWFMYKGNLYELPYTQPLETEREATVDDLDIVKHFLIEKGWNPTEWGERDLTQDSKKQKLPLEKKVKALERYVKETLGGKYKEQRLKLLGCTEENMMAKLKPRLNDFSLKVFTAPKIRVGVAKEMCPNLIKLGEKVEFAKDVADYYTYRHRKSAIAGGDIEDLDFDEDSPNTGYLSMYREQDGRIPTPAIEIGASTNRFKHIGVANIPRTSSLYGENMRAMFGAGKDFVQFGFDYASLEARIQGHYVFDYEGGSELAFDLLQEKPNDVHTQMANKLGIDRTDAKSVNYMFMYGGSANKVVKMLGYTREKAVEFHKNWWDAMLPLKQLKEDKEKEWLQSGKKFITSIDGRRIHIRSQHSIINALFQSAGVICAKYVEVLIFKKFEELGYQINCLEGEPDIANMISYHDEEQLAVKKELLKFKTFKDKETAEDFCSKYKGEQLGAIQKGKNGFYITMPSDVSKIISESIKEVEKMFNMKVELGYEYVTGNNWKDCH